VRRRLARSERVTVRVVVYMAVMVATKRNAVSRDSRVLPTLYHRNKLRSSPWWRAAKIAQAM
jgi:hypothetical protein